MKFDPVPEWGAQDDRLKYQDASSITVDENGNPLVLTRGPSQILEYDAGGAVRNRVSLTLPGRPHGLTIAPDGSWYVASDSDHAVYQVDAGGAVVSIIGNVGVPSDTGYDGTNRRSVVQAAGPFNHPTQVAFGPEGDFFVADGYGNARIHHFSPDAQLIHSWGEPGGGPGEFLVPHGVIVDELGHVIVADRQNHRLQVFEPSGELLYVVEGIQRPSAVALDEVGNWYVAELPIMPDEGPHQPGRVSVFSPDAQLLSRWGDGVGEENMFTAPHDIAVDAEGSVYIAEVSHNHFRGKGPAGLPTLQKFVRTDSARAHR
jgi:streptogramin lyase